MWLSLLVLFNLALAQPLLDVLGRNAEFFLARDAPRADILVVALALTLCLPLVLGAIVALVRLVNVRVASSLHSVLTFALVGSLVLQLEARFLDAVPGLVLVVAAAAIALGFVMLFSRSVHLRETMRLATPLPIVLAILFLFVSPAAELLSGSPVSAAQVKIDNPRPVVMVVFDELPLVSLLDREGVIDERLFPNFGRLAAGSTWYRNATSVAADTVHAVPAILDARYPTAGDLPTVDNHPHSLFTLLGRRMKVVATEPITSVCPVAVCKPTPAGGSLFDRWARIAKDVSIISLHKILPSDLTGGLPAINESWGDFGDSDPAVSPPTAFGRFISGIHATKEPTLYFHHCLLPHVPWIYLPGGQEYVETGPLPGTIPILDGVFTRWGPDPWLIAQGYQRQLLQLGLADRLLGALLDRLDATALYDDALVVVTADHGSAFTVGAPRRVPTKANVGSIASVPLFVKLPGQEDGDIVDAPVQTIDIMPTVASVLGAPIPWDDIDGRSLEGGSATVAGPRRILGHEGIVTFATTGRERFVAKKFGLLKEPGPTIHPYEIGPGGLGSLVGRDIDELDMGDPSGAEVTVANPTAYSSVEPGSVPFPALIEGDYSEHGPIAVALNGKVAAVTRPGRGKTYWHAVLAPRSFRSGPNELRLYAVDTSGPHPVLNPLEVPGG
jgi:hypothetical protein